MENTVKPNNQIVESQQINEDLQFEVTIEKDTIHDSKFVNKRKKIFKKASSNH